MACVHLTASDFAGLNRLAVDAVIGVTGVVEEMHGAVASTPGISWAKGLTSGITGLVCGAVRAITRVAGETTEALLLPWLWWSGEKKRDLRREALLAVINGVVGDHLAATDNPLAIRMRFRRMGEALRLTPGALNSAIPEATGRILVLVHGLCMNDVQWTREGHNHGTALAAALGWTPVDLHYNSGLHISTNGREFAALLEELVVNWPVRVKEIAIIGHSAGGLVTRSACHYGALAQHEWPRRLRHIVFLGTPHHGSQWERLGHWVNGLLDWSSYSAPLARLGNIRSAGITDLRYGNLLDEDWLGLCRFRGPGDRRIPVPLPRKARCYAIAASTGGPKRFSFGNAAGDRLVDLDSALGVHTDPKFSLGFDEAQRWIAHTRNHWDLLSDPDVYARILEWLTPRERRARHSARRRSTSARRSASETAPR